ncbi:uncharacterized protein MONBRDRAFT_36976 [Monosiga brevicollis MX1]|uniref:Prefoldin subunit 2 n=1 Tax=Monosiga brevicollis TaxID=81824 RepID=A9UYR9_MONBE|nr:uncharacterized protein MONBRDRAFT_36976 [Monosiga brevicollis MX1]EDQ89511.1 predicted protein [Monosiga brevicollis MX1]|eukprot:XP_001745540.1 hypothetical protein [Monosiga brevicollis MX1]
MRHDTRHDTTSKEFDRQRTRTRRRRRRSDAVCGATSGRTQDATITSQQPRTICVSRFCTTTVRAQAKKAEPQTQQEIIAHFNDLREDVRLIGGKIGDLSDETEEYKRVSETLRKVDPKRKAYRLIGEVLVERSVQEILPAVTKNYEQMNAMLQQLKQLQQNKMDELAAFQKKHKITMKS